MELCKIREELGSGTFGTVYLADCTLVEMQRHVCVKKLKGESSDSKRRFEKEAGILHSVKGHRNISGYLRFCHEPYAIMMEYSCFDFDFSDLLIKTEVCEFTDNRAFGIRCFKVIFVVVLVANQSIAWF